MDQKRLFALSKIRDQSLAKLKEHEGTLWKEVQGEFHSAWKELPTWILLYEDSEIEKCHAEFTKIVSPYFDEIGDANFTVAYSVYKDNKDVYLEFLNDNNEIARGYGVSGKLADMPEEHPIPKDSIFLSRDSKRP
ncbi:hypothetical protein [Rhizobium sp. FKY42]|uniref:hypothetical protein n=1 Tax=Rhizobium sp. FKY42 TaxID=2562310 RepID=UPI0010BF6745|nr:hypothetical protein [Rhizobium sp. FKY42]